ncbi:MAG: hypothetical protein BWY31_02310 [Lentisphaerae bacterium ADurb.Bin242]|nr:MAG: hypothetical protein BWY31_02310 [Lentisphaerae bacterium ADurb.Bin242]
MNLRFKFYCYYVARVFDFALLSVALLCTMTCLFLTAARLLDPNAEQCAVWNLIGKGILIVAGGCFLILTLLKLEKKRTSIRGFDLFTDSKNRLEAFFLLKKTAHPLKAAQANEASAYFASVRLPWSVYRPFFSLFLILLMLPCSFRLMKNAESAHALVQQEKQIAKKAEEKKKAAAERARELAAEKAALALTLPESESRAKPLDEVEWEGTGESPHGFDTLGLAVYVNGEFKKVFPPEASPKAKGKISFGSVLALEELNVKPFDLVSFHLTGNALVGGKRIELLSEPGFVEVRPFREDAFFLKEANPPGMSAENQEILAMLYGMLDLQIRLNKALFALKIYLKQPHGESGGKVLEKIKLQQEELTKTLEDFLNDPKSRRLPADAVNQLEQALEKMKTTMGSIGKGAL